VRRKRLQLTHTIFMEGRFMNRRVLAVSVATASVALISLAAGQAGPRTFREVGPARVVGGPGVEELNARQARLHEWLTAERPRGTMEARVTVGVTEQELRDLARPRPSGSGPEPLRIGLVKSVQPVFEVAGLAPGRSGGRVAGGEFLRTTDGGFVWSMTVSSPGAYGLRLHFGRFAIPDDADLYVYTTTGEVRGPYQRRGPDASGAFWSNTVFSDTAIVALRHFGPARDEDLRGVSIVIDAVGHLARPFPSPAPQDHTWSHNKCGNASCVVDANCGNLGAATDAASAVAKMEWIQGAFIYTCTGGLLNDGTANPRNLFLTANHCLSKSNANMETFFFYTTSSCNGNCPGSPAPHTTGATVLATGRSGDFTLMELNGNPPSGTIRLGWTNEPIAFTGGADLFRVSNPNFGPQVFSQHDVDATATTCSGWPRGERIYSNDVVGATDGGSSGSPVVRSDGKVVGQLSGCCGFNCADVCDTGANSTVDGALAHYFSSVSSFLSPGGGGCTGNSQCDDGLFCNGAETCSGGSCQAGTSPCASGCDEATDTCVTCAPKGASCTVASDCCSGKCTGPASGKTCR
jgi:V8-like Glu-specific endopeptidase